MLKFYYGTQAQYASATKSDDALYFITDNKKIYKGSVDYSEAARVVASMPASPAQGIVYFDQSDSKVKVYDGTNTVVIGLPASTTVSNASTDNTVATSKAVYDAVSPLAPLASPVFTGTPEAPTASAGTNTTQIATTAFVKTACDAIQTALAGALHFKGVVNTVADLPASGNTEGDVYQVKTNPQGTDAEYVWTLNGETGTGAWEELGAVIDLSAYATKSQSDTYYDAIGAAAAVLGTSGDAASANTVYGAKAYADQQATAAENAAKSASDPAGSAAAAQTAAESYADSLASNYDAAGSAASAAAGVVGKAGDASTANTVYGAKAYADSLASNYDAAGAAATAAAGVVGTASDLATANTVYGAKAYADSVAATALSWNALS